MKKISKVAILLVVLMVFNVFGVFSVMAEPIKDENNIQGSEDNSGIEVIDITREEFLNSMAKSKGITYEEASRLDLKQNRKYGLKASGVTYRTISKTFYYGENSNYSARLETDLKLSGDYIYYQIDQCGYVATRPNSGQYSYDWIQNGATYYGNLPSTSITLSGSGYFKTTVSNSVSAGANIPGFSVSGSSGTTTTYNSNTMSMRYTYNLY